MRKFTFVIIGMILGVWIIFYLIFDKSHSTPSNFNLSLAHKLGRIHFTDQELRRDFDSLKIAAGVSSMAFKRRVQEMRVTDSTNRVVVTRILDSCGWLGFEDVGPDGSNALFLVIQHSDCQTLNKYLPVLRKGVKDGKAPAYNLALMEDRVLICNGQKQKYGSQLSYDEKLSKYVLLPIENFEIVDSLRKRVDLPPIEEYLARWGINSDTLAYKWRPDN